MAAASDVQTLERSHPTPRDVEADQVAREAPEGAAFVNTQTQASSKEAPGASPDEDSSISPPHRPDNEHLRKLEAQLQKMQSGHAQELAQLAQRQETLRNLYARVQTCEFDAVAQSQHLAGSRHESKHLSFGEWSALVVAQERALCEAGGVLASHASILGEVRTCLGQSLESSKAHCRKIANRHNKNVLVLKALQEAVEKLGTMQAERDRDAACCVLAERTVEKLTTTLAREKGNAVHNEYAHQLRLELAAAKERGETGDEVVARAREVCLQRVSRDMLSQVDTLNRANRKVGNVVTEWDSRSATEGAEEPAPKRNGSGESTAPVKRARPPVPDFPSSV